MLIPDTSVLVQPSGEEHPLREPAVRLLRGVVSARVSATTSPEVRQGLRLWGETPSLGSLDAVVAAVAMAHGCAVVSSDRAFGGVPGRDWVDLAIY